MAEPTPAACSRTLEIAQDHPAFAGHFDGFPLLPGVVLLAETLECVFDDPALAQVIGAAPRVANVKFLAPVRPGTSLRITLEATAEGRLRFGVHDGARAVASGLLEAGAP